MKLYSSMGPNPRLVRLFMAEKGLNIETVPVDLLAGENRKEPFLSKNPAGQLPALELDNGAIISETVAICEYLEELQPQPALIGSTAQERAEARMWTRRIDLKICEPLGSGFRFAEGAKLFESRMRIIPEAAPGLKAVAQDGLKWLDGQMAGKEFICGKRLTLADLMLFAFVDFGRGVGQNIDPGCTQLLAWYERMKQRPSVVATA